MNRSQALLLIMIIVIKIILLIHSEYKDGKILHCSEKFHRIEIYQ